MKLLHFIFFLSAASGAGSGPDFAQEVFVSGLESPDVMAFSPDGRLFIGERISGNLRIAGADGVLLPDAFLNLPVPAERHRSAGLRGLTFHPDFPDSPWVYVYYMQDSPRFNRVSRFKTDPINPNRSLAGSEQILIELPSNATGASGSHNGGALLFGADNHLYISTGDGWEDWETWMGGDPVQSLTSFTGKLLRLNQNGSIPPDNPFYETTTGDYRAIYALGFRNPYTMSLHPATGDIYVADVDGQGKDAVKKIIDGGNYKYERSGSWNSSLGTGQDAWAHTGGRVISGGIWYADGNYPPEYQGSYFATGWLSRTIVQIKSESDNSTSTFMENVRGEGGGPVYLIQGPLDKNLYYLTTDYETGAGEVIKISYDDGVYVKDMENPDVGKLKIKISSTNNLHGWRIESTGTEHSAQLSIINPAGRIVFFHSLLPDVPLFWNTGGSQPGVYIIRAQQTIHTFQVKVPLIK